MFYPLALDVPVVALAWCVLLEASLGLALMILVIGLAASLAGRKEVDMRYALGGIIIVVALMSFFAYSDGIWTDAASMGRAIDDCPRDVLAALEAAVKIYDAYNLAAYVERASMPHAYGLESNAWRAEKQWRDYVATEGEDSMQVMLLEQGIRAMIAAQEE